MSVSGVTTFSFTRNRAIDAALRALQQYGNGETPTAIDYTTCTEACNLVLSRWANAGIKLWTVSKVTIPMVDNVNMYPIGSTGGRVYVPASAITGTMTGYTGASTITFSAPSSGVTATGTLTISSGVITAVVMTNQGYGYTTAPTVTLGGPGSGATITASVVGLSAARPVRLVNAPFVRQLVGTDPNNYPDINLQVLGRADYEMIGNKRPGGSIINSVYPDFQLTDLNLYVYPLPGSSVSTECHLFVERPIDVMVSSTDDFDMPPQAFSALKWQFMEEVMLEYYVKPVHMQYIMNKSNAFLQEMLDAQVEWEASTFFQYNAQQRND